MVASKKTSLCQYCKNSEEGILKIDSKSREDLVRIETMMMCGCGGYVTHNIFKCKKCNKYYLSTFEDHWPPSTADLYIYLISKKDAEKLAKEIKKCKNLNNEDCGCPVHRKHERIQIKGEKKYFESM